MDKVDRISPLVEELDGLAQEDHKEEEKNLIKDAGLDRKDEEEKEDLKFEIEEDQETEEGEKEEDEPQEEEEEKVIKDVGLDHKEEEEEDIENLKFEEEDEPQEEEKVIKDVYKDLVLHPKVSSRKKGETVHGIQVMDVPFSPSYKRYEFDLCPTFVKPWTLDNKTHQLSSLPCGHMFRMSCLKKWIKDHPSDKIPQCYQNFLLESVTPLNAPHLCIPAAADQKVDHISLLELDEAEKEVEKEMEMDLDDNDDDEDFEKVEELTLPFVSQWELPDDGPPIHGLEVPVMKEDEFIQDSMYRNDIDIDDADDDPPLPPHVFDPLPPPPAPVCSICYKHWTPLHHFCSLPCGHIFGFQCIKSWLQTNLRDACPQCNALCSVKDVKPLYTTRLCIPAADKGVADPEISTRRFAFSKQGFVKFRKFESGRRNFALKKRSDAKKRLAGVVGRKNDLLKRRTDLLDRRVSVLNRAKALEQRGGSLCRIDALRLRADALDRWADEYLQQAKACEGRAEALGQRARAYDQRVKAFEARLRYFSQSYDNLPQNPTHCAAAATCHKD